MKSITIGVLEDHSDDVSGPSATAAGVVSAIESKNGRAIYIDAGGRFQDSLLRYGGEIDMVFNISEDVVPDVGISDFLDSINMPYTGPGRAGRDVGNDKARTRMVLDGCVVHPGWQFIKECGEPLGPHMRYPVFVKPVDGTYSVGLTQDCVVFSENDLEGVVSYVMKITGNGVIVEEFLGGMEYDAGVIGNIVLPPLQYNLGNFPGKPLVRDHAVKKNFSLDVPGFIGPVESDDVADRLAVQTVAAHKYVGAKDYSRSDFRSRKGSDGEPLFLEINTLPGLNPKTSVIPVAASFAGIEYNDVVGGIVYSALKRNSADPRYIGKLMSVDGEGFGEAYGRMSSMVGEGDVLVIGGDVYGMIRPMVMKHGS